jgi:hypothetical protein
MDCLDRTNVVQSVVARIMLVRVLRDLAVFGPQEGTTGDFEAMFKNCWADNADAVSMQYSGTGALKTDYTRTGKRGVRGMIGDGVNSCVRYVRNNFMDGGRQDSFDLFLGVYVVGAGRSPFEGDGGREKEQVMLGACLCGVSVALFAMAYLWIFSCMWVLEG